MLQKYSNIISWIVLMIITIGVVRFYDFVTKKPIPISRETDPRILQLDSEIAVLKSGFQKEAKRRDSAEANFIARIDSIKLDNQKAKNEKIKLYKTPDKDLIHYRDSIRRANGL